MLMLLLIEAAEAMVREFEAEDLGPSRVSLVECRALIGARVANRPLMLRELHEVCNIEISTLSRTVNALQKRMLMAKRRVRGGDGRAVEITITEKGKKLTANLMRAMAKSAVLLPRAAALQSELVAAIESFAKRASSRAGAAA